MFLMTWLVFNSRNIVCFQENSFQNNSCEKAFLFHISNVPIYLGRTNKLAGTVLYDWIRVRSDLDRIRQHCPSHQVGALPFPNLISVNVEK